MAENQISTLKEWAPLSELLNKLPISTGGIFSQDIKLTCIDILPEFFALGSNVGIVYWYNRRTKILQRLQCETPNISITFVKIVSTVEFMVACGNQNGNITIFQIPKSYPDSLPENLKPKQKQIERYTVSELHKSPITAIEWSKNGMKLFSGDKNGTIVLTEIDFYMHICKSLEILNESYEVIQLSYNQQRLLVSTIFRSIICYYLDKWKVCQVGKKDRKVLGMFGGLVYQFGFKPADVLLYCTRPGLRMWIADVEGNVQKTLLFKDLLCKECPQVPLLNPISKELEQLKPQCEPSFGPLLPFSENLLVTYNNDIVYILDPEKMTILAMVCHLRGILDIKTYKDELFILEEGRSLLRISFWPEPGNSNILPYSPLISSTFSVTPRTKNALFSNSTSLSLLPQGEIDIHTDENMILNAEEAKESPKENHKNFDEIGKQEFEENILFKKTKSRRRVNRKNSDSRLSLNSNSSEEKELSYTRPAIMHLNTVGALPDLRSPESIINDIEYKEKILADILNLDKVKIALEQKSPCSVDKCNESVEENDTKSTSNEVQYNNDIHDIPHFKDILQNGTTFKKENGIHNAPVVNIPEEWKLRDVEILAKEASVSAMPPTVFERKLSRSDSSLSEWEIV